MRERFRAHGKLPVLVVAAWALAACENAGTGDRGLCDQGLCAAGSGAPAASPTGSPTSSGGSGPGGGSGGRAAASGGSGGGSAVAPGGPSAGSAGSVSASGGTGGGGMPGTSSTGGTGGSGGTGGTDAGAAQPPLPDFTLVVDAPADGATVSGTVTVSGRAPGFLNVEVWDATHQNPPLVQATPAADGAFSASVDASALASGSSTWTVYAWDSGPGQSFMHTANVPLNLTIGPASSGGDPCAGQTCSGHGSCSASGGSASCGCDAGYHAVSLSCIADSSGGGGGGSPDPGTSYVPSGYTLKFSDEFDGSTLDTGKWNTLAPFGVQFFSDSHQKQAFVPEGVTVHDGVATFTAKRASGASNANGQPYTSGSITTNGTFTYGYFETRARVPAGKGFWPAYWLTSSSRWPPEWDIFEIIDGVIYGYTHPVSGGTCSFVDGAAGSDDTYTIANVYGQYHIYGFEWTASELFWYVDGVMTEHYQVNAAAGANDPFWLNISLQVGGDWPGDPDSSTPLPSTMDVDYMRVYQK